MLDADRDVQRLTIKNRLKSAVVQDQATAIKNLTVTHELLVEEIDELRIRHAQVVLGGTFIDELAARREIDQA